jgi:anti-anti-sigma factor
VNRREGVAKCKMAPGSVFLLNLAETYADKIAKTCRLLKYKEIKMGIQDWSEDIILVDLPQEPEMGDELKMVTGIVRDRGDCEVVIDFSNVDIITSSSISKLLKLRKLLADCGHRLVFCSVAAATRGIFTVTGLDGIFEFADDKFVALASLQMVS